MPMKYFPNRIYTGKVPAVESLITKRIQHVSKGAQSIAASGLDVVISSSSDTWKCNSISFLFDSSTAKTYWASVMSGRKIVQNMNDYLWFLVDGTCEQRIILDAGFYNGTQLATQLQTKLNANAAYIAAVITFTVAYDNITGLFTITPSAGNIKYINVLAGEHINLRDSIAGYLFGLNVTSVSGPTVVTDTPIKGLNTEAYIFRADGAGDLTRYNDTAHTLDIDQAVHLVALVGPNVNLSYTVVYEDTISSI